MFKLYTWFKEHPSHTVTAEDIEVMTAKKTLSSAQAKKYFNELAVESGTIEAALKRQANLSLVCSVCLLSSICITSHSYFLTGRMEPGKV